MTLPAQVGLLLGVFAGTTAISLAVGATNLGTAMGIGQISFAIVLVWLLLRR